MEALGSYLAGFTATVRGRGLCKEEEILEFQTALVSSEKTEYERIRKVSAEFEACLLYTSFGYRYAGSS